MIELLNRPINVALPSVEEPRDEGKCCCSDC